MHRISHFAVLAVFIFLLSCSPPQPLTNTLFIYRFNPPAFLEYNEDFQQVKEIPFQIPLSCGLFNTFPAPVGQFLLIELSCPNGQTVLFLDVDTGSTTQPITDTDAHFLAWTADGKSAYLKVDSLGSPKMIRAYTNGARDVLDIPELTYDLSAKPDAKDFTFTFSRGLGYGSELHFAQHDGKTTLLLYADQYNYISLAKFSPDGKHIVFIKTPDTQTPFTVGELWVINSDGTNAHKLADADAGHGYAANWSPDGKKIAYVVRENPEDVDADHSSDVLISNIYIVDVASGKSAQLTSFTEGRAETPYWSPDGNILTFNVVINGRMQVHIADIVSVGVGSPNPVSAEINDIETESACCPAWMRK